MRVRGLAMVAAVGGGLFAAYSLASGNEQATVTAKVPDVYVVAVAGPPVDHAGRRAGVRPGDGPTLAVGRDGRTTLRVRYDRRLVCIDADVAGRFVRLQRDATGAYSGEVLGTALATRPRREVEVRLMAYPRPRRVVEQTFTLRPRIAGGEGLAL